MLLDQGGELSQCSWDEGRRTKDERRYVVSLVVGRLPLVIGRFYRERGCLGANRDPWPIAVIERCWEEWRARGDAGQGCEAHVAEAMLGGSADRDDCLGGGAD